ncbi:MAG: FKBP-type peptidyl-prolyl cis-trans isomerase [Deltaproteobacteria bacterium]|nr:FKBP-type peptidyl-prolyl cis-trans isomerase [Deltaproteobacteria bacterium]
MKLKNMLIVVVTLGLGGLAGACGKKETPPTEPTKVPEATTAPAATAPAEADATAPAPEEKDTATAAAPAPAANPDDPFAPPADVAAAPADAQSSPSGLKWKVMKEGTGADHPSKRDTVEVHYTGWTTDGKMFDSSKKRGQPAKFPLNGVIPGWTEGVQLMTVGSTYRFWIPGNLAYGDKPMRPGAPAGTLVFDVELLSIEKAETIPAPADVAAAPADATKTASGLAYKELKPGDGKTHPTAENTVKVNYTGWTTDGEMFDSSVVRKQPAVFPLGGVIPGWTEGVQLMTVGSTFRFWIPGNLAYGDTPKRPGAPAGTLVFDVELLEIVK